VQCHSSMEDLRVPKRAVAVEVVLPGGNARRVSVFLGEGAAAHEGPERLSDLLNGDVPFIPAQDAESGLMTFLHRASVAVARVAAADEPADASFTSPTEHEVEITLTDGSSVNGLVAYVAPESHERLVDFLNRPEPFFRLLERDGVALVGRAHVARVACLSR
jgi:hypothetical protein